MRSSDVLNQISRITRIDLRDEKNSREIVFSIRGIFDIFQPIGISSLSLKSYDAAIPIGYDDHGFMIFYRKD